MKEMKGLEVRGIPVTRAFAALKPCPFALTIFVAARGAKAAVARKQLNPVAAGPSSTKIRDRSFAVCVQLSSISNTAEQTESDGIFITSGEQAGAVLTTRK